jgi:hypothetical protein
MTEPMSQEVFDALTEYLKDDTNARKLVIDLLFVGHLWDDLIDKDLERTDEDINRAFRTLMVDNQLNPFYQAYRDRLDPLISSTALLWLDSVQLEKKDKLTAFILRNAFLGIIQYCGLLLGGTDWVLEKGPDLWAKLGLNEKFAEFLKE